MARVSRRRCSKSARLGVGDAAGVEVGAGAGEDGEAGSGAGSAGEETGGRVCAAAAPVCFARRESPADFPFAGLARAAGLVGGGGAASGVLARVQLSSAPLSVAHSAWLGGGSPGGATGSAFQ